MSTVLMRRTEGRVRIVPTLRGRGERGAVTAEYAIATIAAVGLAGLLVVLLRSGLVNGLITNLIQHALAIPA